MVRRVPGDGTNGDSFGALNISDGGGDHDVKPRAVSSSSNAGLSELSKQLRALQSTNHAHAATIDKLERQLKIMSDLKGVSVGDLKSALSAACQGEAFNELRMQVETLRAQLAIASASKPSKNFKESATTHAMANLELRVGELEEVEESLRSQISKLYQQLRDETTQKTRFESSTKGFQQQTRDLEQQYKEQLAQLNKDHAAVVSRMQVDYEESSQKVITAESYSLREKERVEALRIQVAEYQGLELQLTKSRAKAKELEETRERLESDTNAIHQDEVQELNKKLETMKQRAVTSETKLQVAHDKIATLEQQAANKFTLELLVAKQKVQLKELQENSQKNTTQLESSRKVERDTATAEMTKLEKRAGAMEAKLQAELAKSASLEKQLERVSELEHTLAEQKDELAAQKKRAERYRKERDKAVKEKKADSNKEMEGYETRLKELQGTLFQENMRVSELEVEASKVRDLQAKYDRQRKEMEDMETAKATFMEQEKDLKKENERVKGQLKQLNAQLLDATMNNKLEEDTARSLQTQIQSTEKETKLRKEQFESRLEVQGERVHDLEQQLDSLYTAFNMERGERTEEMRTQTVLQMSLDDADAKVAHQLHDIEENEQQPPRSPVRETLVHATAVPHTPGSASRSSSHFQTPLSPVRGSHTTTTTTTTTPQPQVGLAQGYLYKKDKFKGWKKRYFFLHGNLTTGLFTMSYSESKGKPSKGGIQGIQAAVSRVQTSSEFAKQPFAFVLRVNPYDNRAPTVYLAASTQDELDTWMTALQMATQGVETQSPAAVAHQQHSHPVGSQVVIVDLVNHPEYNGLCGVVTTPIKEDRQCVQIESLNRKVKLSPANLELFALPADDSANHDSATQALSYEDYEPGYV